MHLKILSFMKGAETDVKVKINQIEISKSDLVRLSEEMWLNDSIIEASIELIVRRSKTKIFHLLQRPTLFSFSTFFHPTLRMKGHEAADKLTQREDIFQYDILIVPVHKKG